MCVCVFTEWSHHSPNWVWQVTKLFCSYNFIAQNPSRAGLEGSERPFPPPAMRQLQGGFQQNPCPGKGDGVSWFAWSCLLGFLSGINLEFSQELWRRWADTQNSVFRVIRISSSYTGDEKLFHIIPDMLALPPVQGHGLAQVSVEDSVSVLEWFVLENIFSSHFGAVKKLKNPAFFLNAAEF